MYLLTLQLACLVAGQADFPPFPTNAGSQSARSEFSPAGSSGSPAAGPPTAKSPISSVISDTEPANRQRNLDDSPAGEFRPPLGIRTQEPRSVAPVAFSAVDRDHSQATELARYCRLTAAELPADANERSVSLLELLSRVSGPSTRLRAIQQYWNLAAAAGRYRFAAEEEQTLVGLLEQRQSYDPQLAAETSAVRAEMQQSRLALLQQQQQLGAGLLSASNGGLVWPADSPLVGPYRTQFESLFSNQPTPPRLKQIDRELPLLATLVDLRAEAVVAAEQAISGISPNNNLNRWLDSHLRLRNQRREFVAALLQYNLKIAEYSLSVTDPGTPAETLISTLIRPSDQSDLVAVQPPTRSSTDSRPETADRRGAPFQDPAATRRFAPR